MLVDLPNLSHPTSIVDRIQEKHHHRSLSMRNSENRPRETVNEIALNVQQAKKLIEQGFKY
jgi:hypothetical protein